MRGSTCQQIVFVTKLVLGVNRSAVCAWAQRLCRTRMIREAIFDFGRATAIAGFASRSFDHVARRPNHVLPVAGEYHRALTLLPNIRELT
jgi:hypothetical protein